MSKIRIFSIILNFLFCMNTFIIAQAIPTATAEIEFELEVTDTVKVEPVYLDFGNILKNSNTLNTAQSYFNLSTGFKQDMLITTTYNEGVQVGEYTKIDVPKQGGKPTDKLDVYLYNIKDRVLSSGDYKIPIIGEIREVGDIELGKYEKTIKMDVIITPISPTKK
ncbi:hypothetical protein [Cetobacterium sp.]|uniref:hypothetical protein n=1 Tax=Cetobacterium sp. TaxID=2071632 RepID=UPI003F36B99D